MLGLNPAFTGTAVLDKQKGEIQMAGDKVQEAVQPETAQAVPQSPAATRVDAAPVGIQEVSDANFEQSVLKSDQTVMVDFWATWCGPCKALSPVVDEIARAYNGKAKVFKMDVDRNNATPMRYGVRGIPTLLIFKEGKVAEQIVGYVPKDTIQKALDKHV
jgi:thioredoxin 1